MCVVLFVCGQSASRERDRIFVRCKQFYASRHDGIGRPTELAGNFENVVMRMAATPIGTIAIVHAVVYCESVMCMYVCVIVYSDASLCAVRICERAAVVCAHRHTHEHVCVRVVTVCVLVYVACACQATNRWKITVSNSLYVLCKALRCSPGGNDE